MLNFLHKASSEFDVPGDLFRAISKESITNFLSILFFLIFSNSPLRKLKSKGALCIMIFLSSIKFKKSSAIFSKVSLSLKNSSENPCTLYASSGTFLAGFIIYEKLFLWV